MSTRFSQEAIRQVRERAEKHFVQRCPKSVALAKESAKSWYAGVPMHWMADWPSPVPLFVDQAQGARFRDVDGNVYTDFCLGDTGAMFGHSPEPLAQALSTQAHHGLTTMLPSADTPWVGNELKRRFGMDFWQVAATATDANRYALRWARAITGRPKILVFDGCYHGTVEETMVRLSNGEVVPRPGQIGAANIFNATTKVVEFNDLNALEASLAEGDVAAVLAEPVMTNIGMVLPDPGFHQAQRALTRRFGSLLIIDETHTISTGPGGYTKSYNLEPDIFVMGKPIAGGVSCSIFGVTADLAKRMQAVKRSPAPSGHGHSGHGHSGHGHSGMGTTLSANPLAMKAMRANLESVMTDQAYNIMLTGGIYLRTRLEDLIRVKKLPWCVTQIGARCEFQFSQTPPRTGREAESAFDSALEGCIHLSLLNRGFMITPFHNMMLISPSTTKEDINAFALGLGEIIDELDHA